MDMKAKTRHLIAVTLVATALCADRMALAAPSAPPVGQLAGRLIQRLSGGFRTELRSVRLYRPARNVSRPMAIRPAISCQVILPPTICLSPFQFRLPPPCA